MTSDPAPAPRPARLRRLGLGLALLGLGTGCLRGEGGAAAGGAGAGPALLEAAAPLPPLADAYAAAGSLRLAEVQPEERPLLHNLFRLSDKVISGSEPAGEGAFRILRDMGVRTLLSVDGKVPDAATAARFGMRYVHVPIQYRGIRPEEMLRLAKVFRELEPPFYVHCFHGKHRGPAAAAVGRLVLDGISREQAIAEMRQWCGTSPRYPGLYQAVATEAIPSPAESAAFKWDFPPAHPFKGFRQAMIGITRSFDRLQELSRRNWEPDPGHPDLDAANEAAQLARFFHDSPQLEEVLRRPADFRGWLSEAAGESARLELLLAVNTPETAAEAKGVLARLKALCSTCHSAYRND